MAAAVITVRKLGDELKSLCGDTAGQWLTAAVLVRLLSQNVLADSQSWTLSNRGGGLFSYELSPPPGFAVWLDGVRYVVTDSDPFSGTADTSYYVSELGLSVMATSTNALTSISMSGKRVNFDYAHADALEWLASNHSGDIAESHPGGSISAAGVAAEYRRQAAMVRGPIVI